MLISPQPGALHLLTCTQDCILDLLSLLELVLTPIFMASGASATIKVGPNLQHPLLCKLA